MTDANQNPPEGPSRQSKLLELARLRREVAELERELDLEHDESASGLAGDEDAGRLQAEPLQDDQQDAREALIAAERVSSMANLARAIAHEINNPLSMCLGYLQHAVDQAADYDDSSALETTLNRLSRGVQRIRGIVSELQMLSEEMIGENERLDLADVIERVCALVPPELRGAIELDLEPVSVWVDRPRLYQIVHNMIMPYLLALRAEDPALNKVEVRCCPHSGRDALLEVVADTAPSAGTRTDLLSAIRGEYTANTLPLRLARRLALEVGAQWNEGYIDDGRYRTAALFVHH